MRLHARLLLCIECGKACRCDLYVPWEAHAHLPGGDDRYPLCEPCEQAFLLRHRKVMDEGRRGGHKIGPMRFEWLDRCAESCPYDHIRETVPIRQGLEAER